MVKLTEKHFILTPEGAEALIDENTIGMALYASSLLPQELMLWNIL